MGIKNLAICFSPSILRPLTESKSLILADVRVLHMALFTLLTDLAPSIEFAQSQFSCASPYEQLKSNSLQVTNSPTTKLSFLCKLGEFRARAVNHSQEVDAKAYATLIKPPGNLSQELESDSKIPITRARHSANSSQGSGQLSVTIDQKSYSKRQTYSHNNLKSVELEPRGQDIYASDDLKDRLHCACPRSNSAPDLTFTTNE